MLRWSQTKCRTFRGEGLRVVGWVWVRISSQKIMGEMQSNDPKRVLGERGRTRTCDPCLKRALLYQLSYAPTIIQSNTTITTSSEQDVPSGRSGAGLYGSITPNRGRHSRGRLRDFEGN